MRTTRKRAIERARRLTRMGTIEVGDTVEVIRNSTNGYEVGTLGIVENEYTRPDGSDGFFVRGYKFTVWKNINLKHPKSDLKLIEKGEK